MSSRAVRSSPRLRERNAEVVDLNVAPIEQAPVVSQAPVVVSTPPTIDLDAIEDDDDVVILSASAFDQAQKENKKRGRTEPGLSKSRARRRSDSANDANKSRKSAVVAPVAPVEEPKFNCPICIGPLTEETSTKCGHIFCKACIRKAISCQNKCPTCRKHCYAKDLIRVFLPSRAM